MNLYPRVVVVLIAITCFAQTPPTFEVASVRLSESGIAGPPVQVSPNSLTIHGLSLQNCVQMAWQTPQARVIGPAWLNDIHLDIAAKTSGPVDQKQLFLMLRQLLADRMGLKAHIESREAPVYALTVAKGGPKLQPSTSDGPPSSMNAKGMITTKHVTMADFANMLSQGFGRPFVDATELTGRYDFRIDTTPYMASIDTEHPNQMDAVGVLIAALQEQLGLKVEARKDMVDMLVIDHAEKLPTEN